MKKLGSHLQENYEMKGTTIRPKFPVKVKINEKEIDVTPLVWVLGNTSKKYPDMIVSCTNILKHSGALFIKRKAGIKFKEGSYTIVKFPKLEYLPGKQVLASDGHGYATIETENGTVGDGEIHRNTLQPSMHPFALTMLRKRAEDRAILKEAGLYEKGIYSEVEITPDMLDSSSEEIPITNEKKKELLDKLFKASDYLNQTTDKLIGFISDITGQPTKNIDIESMSSDIIATVIKKLTPAIKKEERRRKELISLIVKEKKSSLKSSDLQRKHSSELEKLIK